MLHEIYDDFFRHDGRFLSETKLSKALLLISSSFEKRKKNRKLRFFSRKKVAFTFFYFCNFKIIYRYKE